MVWWCDGGFEKIGFLPDRCTVSEKMEKRRKDNGCPANPGLPGRRPLNQYMYVLILFLFWCLIYYILCYVVLLLCEHSLMRMLCVFSDVQFCAALPGTCDWWCDQTLAAVTGMCAHNDHSVSVSHKVTRSMYVVESNVIVIQMSWNGRRIKKMPVGFWDKD